MRVSFLRIRNFRNIEETSFAPAPGINLILGANGQGKTSILEALGFLSSLRSFRDTKTGAVIRNESENSDIRCQLSSTTPEYETELRVALQLTDKRSKKGNKTAFVNNKPLRSSMQYLSQRFGSFQLGFHAVIFNPSDHDLVNGEPALRRSYLDRVSAAESIEYLTILRNYQKALEQRNALLKQGSPFSDDLMEGYTAQYCTLGAQLALYRLRWIQRLAEPLERIIAEIAPNQNLERGKLKLTYLSSWVPELTNFTGHGELPSLKLLEHSFQEKVHLLSTAERRIGYSLVGPHRDDWTFYLGNQVLKGFGSQGESRSALLALKLAEIELFRSQTGHKPIFLLDDFSSELDRERRLFLMRFLREIDLQTFITTTEASGFLQSDDFQIYHSQTSKTFVVTNGKIRTDDAEKSPVKRENVGNMTL